MLVFLIVTLPSPRDGYCSGRYASYWNAGSQVLGSISANYTILSSFLRKYEVTMKGSRFSDIIGYLSEGRKLDVHTDGRYGSVSSVTK